LWDCVDLPTIPREAYEKKRHGKKERKEFEQLQNDKTAGNCVLKNRQLWGDKFFIFPQSAPKTGLCGIRNSDNSKTHKNTMILNNHTRFYLRQNKKFRGVRTFHTKRPNPLVKGTQVAEHLFWFGIRRFTRSGQLSLPFLVDEMCVTKLQKEKKIEEKKGETI